MNKLAQYVSPNITITLFDNSSNIIVTSVTSGDLGLFDNFNDEWWETE